MKFIEWANLIIDFIAVFLLIVGFVVLALAVLGGLF